LSVAILSHHHAIERRGSESGFACALERFFKNRSRGRQATRTLSTAFSNSRSRTSPRSAMGIRADARAYTPARDGGLREKACSTAFPGQPAKAEPSRLCETSRRGRHNRRALQRASPRSERRSRPIPHGPAAACIGGTFRCGAVSLTHLERTLCMCVKIAAMGRAGRFGSPGGRVKMFDKNLVHAIVGGKDLDCGSAELSVNLVLTRGHGSLLLDL
ncbi:MAG: hypothetical protein JWO80_1023, partial [Bryobacterales bacterium]|nr:hypothetical protein [Bryobacterales bacterium]